ncbi:hypothetical protein [Granulicella sp. S156]|uniref:hypothetical protein n=1 Tax=Granulicella sp. S156 TaxID=1747224 RepID=UPI00131EC203|nr:hypothetical protein [Granulicella sp. S156]
MIELAKLIHTALRSDSTWTVVLALAFIGAVIFGGVGFLVNTAYLSGLPHLDIQITALNVGTPGPPYEGQGALIVMQAIVSNAGSQSAVRDWNLYVNFPDKTQVKAIPLPTDTQLELKGNDYRLFRGDDALYKKTIAPIQQGQIVPGFLAFILPGKTSADILIPSVSFQLVAMDAYGKLHTAVKTREQFKNEVHFPLIPVQ